MSTMLLSIKPKYAKVILEGKKQYEFRKKQTQEWCYSHSLLCLVPSETGGWRSYHR